MGDDLVQVSVGKGRYEYLRLEDIFNESDSGDDFQSDDDDFLEPNIINIDNVIENHIAANCDSTEVPDPDAELDRLLNEFDKVCTDNKIDDISEPIGEKSATETPENDQTEGILDPNTPNLSKPGIFTFQ